MRMIKEVLRLYQSCGLSQKRISKALGCARGTVAEYLYRAKTAGISWPLPEGMDDAQLESRLFPPVGNKGRKPLPDFNYVHTELKKKGVTRIQLWSEYREEHPDGYSESQFCELYSRYIANLNIVMRQEHKAGHKAFSDFAGKTLPITDPKTGEIKPAHLFVCTLGASSFTFAELYWNESTESWCNGHAAAFEYFDGCPEIVVPDNPKPVVTKTNPYEPDINPSFAQMAAHYNIAVIPARVRKPKDKAKVECAVGVATRWILAVLRKRTFFSLQEARSAVRELLDKLNDRPFQKMPGSRRSLFQSVDAPALKPLPALAYEYAQFKKATANVDYHIDYDGHCYSVPYQLRGKVVEIRATSTTIEVFHKGKRVATHPRYWAEFKKVSTLAEHRPKSHSEYGDWPPERLLNWAGKIGPKTKDLLKAIMAKYKYPEQAYRSCLGILRLSKKYDEARLEAACHRALAIRGLSFKSVNAILKANLDLRPLPEKPNQLTIIHDNIRGPGAFTQTGKENNHVNQSHNRQDPCPETIRHG